MATTADWNRRQDLETRSVGAPGAGEGYRVGRATRGDSTSVNVGGVERLASVMAGSVLALYGTARAVTRGSLGGVSLALAGGALLYRGLSGHSYLYGALGIDRSGPVTGNLGVKIEKTIRVNAPRDQVFRLWRNFENLPRFMSHLERVSVTGPKRSRWTVKAPAGMHVEWEAEIINEIPNELIAWQSIGNPMVASAGSVRFEGGLDGQTAIHVSLQYDPPGGEVGHAVATLLGEDAGQRIEEDLENFQSAVESGRLVA